MNTIECLLLFIIFGDVQDRIIVGEWDRRADVYKQYLGICFYNTYL